mmetsp:Transcript_4880/g.10640  ORF Transcript_4880/g.10640 Transcript_4880/m.10640 type:complete len:433 (+) Transcript_4880:1445-2743(+)
MWKRRGQGRRRRGRANGPLSSTWWDYVSASIVLPRVVVVVVGVVVVVVVVVVVIVVLRLCGEIAVTVAGRVVGISVDVLRISIGCAGGTAGRRRRCPSLEGPPGIPVHQHPPDEEIQDALGQDDPHDVVDLAVVDRNPTVAALPDHPQDAGHRHGLGHGHHLHPRLHDLPDFLILQIQHPLDHLLLGVIDGARIPGARDDEPQLRVGHARRLLGLDPEEFERGLGEGAEREAEGADDAGQDVDGGDHQPGHSLGVDDPDVLGEELDEEERDGRQEDGAPLLGEGPEDVIGEVREERGGVDGAGRGRDEDGGEDAGDVLVEGLEGAPAAGLAGGSGGRALLLLLFGEFADLPGVERGDGDFGRVEEGEGGEDGEPEGQFGGQFVGAQGDERGVGVAFDGGAAAGVGGQGQDAGEEEGQEGGQQDGQAPGWESW